MRGKSSTTDMPGMPFAGLCCPMCDYDLTGTTEPRCPECGKGFDPAALRKDRAGWCGRPRRWVTFGLILLAVYLPNTWIFWIDYPWSGGYRMLWVTMFPVLPVLLPGAWCYHVFGMPNNIDQLSFMVFLGVMCAGLIAVCYWIGKRSRVALAVVAVAVFTLEVLNALASYALFRM
ncbi:MAG: hypothetical protein R3C45_22795 [Phycisphaerales bacterium]